MAGGVGVRWVHKAVEWLGGGEVGLQVDLEPKLGFRVQGLSLGFRAKGFRV